jgi:hypothetical protein
MREIVTPSGEVYARVKLEDNKLMLQLCKGSARDLWIQMDAKVIPQLRNILAEADFFKHL